MHLMSPHFLPPPPPGSYLSSPSCFFVLFPPQNDIYPIVLFFHIQMRCGPNACFSCAAFDMEIHLPQKSKTMQLYYLSLSVRHAVATRPAGGNEVFLHCWGGEEDWQ